MTLLDAKCTSNAVNKAITPVCSTTFVRDPNESNIVYRVRHTKCYHYSVSKFSLSRNVITNEHKKTLIKTKRMRKGDLLKIFNAL